MTTSLTVMWGDSVPKLATQGVSMAIPLRVYSPADDATAVLDLTITSPEAFAAGDVKYRQQRDRHGGPASDSGCKQSRGHVGRGSQCRLQLGDLVRHGHCGAPVGNYDFGVSLQGGNTLESIGVSVSAPAVHGEKPPDVGDTTAPTLTITEADTRLESTATVRPRRASPDATLECRLTTNGVAGTWESCSATKTYSNLQPGIYTFSARATDAAKNVGEVEVYALVIPAAAPSDTQTGAVVPPTTSGPTGAATSAPPAAGAQASGAPSAATPVVPSAVVKLKAIDNGTKLFVNVNPNKGTGHWNIKVYRKVVKGDQVSWEKVGKTLRTKTSKETRTINLGKGTYRVKVMEKYGMKGDVSKQVTLVR